MRLAALVLVLTCGTAAAQGVVEEPEVRTPFDRGRINLYLGAGSQKSAIVVGGAFGYFVLAGLELSLGGQYQWGDGPSIAKLTPGLRYVAQPLVLQHWPVVPYVGVFASHYFVGAQNIDEDALGTRGGLLYVSGNFVLGLGVAVERVISECTDDCTSVYPDFTVSLSL